MADGFRTTQAIIEPSSAILRMGSVQEIDSILLNDVSLINSFAKDTSLKKKEAKTIKIILL